MSLCSCQCVLSSCMFLCVCVLCVLSLCMSLCVSMCAFACFLYVCYPVLVYINLCVIKNLLYDPKVSTIPLCNSLV